jgi:hypothetical protein
VNGLGPSANQDQCFFAEIPGGDAFDFLLKPEDKSIRKTKQVHVQELLPTPKNDEEIQDTDAQLKNVYESYSNAAGEESIPFTIAESALEIQTKMSDKGEFSLMAMSDVEWIGSDKDPVRNFVNEELYIHTKVDF